MSNEMGYCNVCGDEALVQVGEDKTPLCLTHFDLWIRGVKALIEGLQDGMAERKGER